MGRMTFRLALPTTALVLALAFPAAAQQVTRIESGDTIVVDGVGKVRLIGIRSVDESPLGVAPNTQPPARTDPPSPTSLPPTAIGGGIKLKPNRPSKDFLTTMLLGQTVKLQRDPLIGDKGKLAYVFLQDGMLVNAEMLRRGAARGDFSREFAHEQEFKKIEADAHEAGTGVWAVLPK
jgi:endonuclease YncB( thermonuclease family)